MKNLTQKITKSLTKLRIGSKTDGSVSYMKDENIELLDILTLPDSPKINDLFHKPNYLTDKNEWIAFNTLGLFVNTTLITDVLNEKYCTADNCPEMTNPSGSSFKWLEDGESFEKMEAPVFYTRVLAMIEKKLDDPSIFPTQKDVKFSDNFDAEIKKIYSYLYKIYLHIYHAHFDQLVKHNLHTYLNTVFAHLIFIIDEFELIAKDEFKIFNDFIKILRSKIKKLDEKRNKGLFKSSSKEASRRANEPSSREPQPSTSAGEPSSRDQQASTSTSLI